MRAISNNYAGYNLFGNDLENLPKFGKLTINTINQYSFCIAQQDVKFKKALLDSDILLPDGIGIILALKAVTGKVIKKISGAQLHHHLLTKLNIENGKCFYLGASENTLSKIRERMAKDFPNIKCESYSPPFKKEFSEEDNSLMLQKVNLFNPEVLFVGMTAPKQEKWVNDHKDELHANIICSIGAVFDFYAGTVKRPSEFWVHLGLEWFVRLCKEPKRMWKRYLYYGPIFMYQLFREMLYADLVFINEMNNSESPEKLAS